MRLKRAPAAVIASLMVVGALVVWRMNATSTAGEQHYSAQIRRTEHGIPHITAKDYGGLGYGYGYAFAQDNLCVLASWVVTLRGERSRYFGARTMSDDPIEPTRNIASDVYYKGLRQSGVIQRELDRPAPHGPTAQLRSMVDGYVAGYNRYLRDTGAAKLPDPSCRGKDWVRPITAMDIWTSVVDTNRTESSTRFKEAIALAVPGGGTAAQHSAPPKKGAKLVGPGSNAWALGRKATRSGNGMLLSDPHRPWNGISRFYQAQLTIPGVLNVSGAGLYGTPVLQLGHTAGLAWTHTTSHAQRYSLYKLTLVPGKPTRYLVDGKPESMREQKVKVTVQDAGQTFTVTRTLYSSRYGPVLANEWTDKTAYALADVNAVNLRSASEWLAMGAAQNLTQLRAVQTAYQGLPYVYTLATDASGTAYFADASVVPNVTDALAARCRATGGESEGSSVLDGSRSACGWGRDADAIEPGIFGPSRYPTLTRTDYVANSNNGPWLVNPSAPLTGYPRIYGGGRTEPKLRPRLSLDLIAQRLSGADGLGPSRFTLPTLQAAATTKRNLSADLGRADVVAACRAHPSLTATSGRRIDVRQACDTLASWNGRAGLDGKGAILWRQFFTQLGIDHPTSKDQRWRVPFDPRQPLTTPRGLNGDSPAVQHALADAVEFFQTNRIPVTLTPGAAQHYASVPVPGCTDDEGCFDRIDPSGDLGNGGRYDDIQDGSSLMMAVEMTPTGPRGRTLLTYSESADPTSPHHADQTALFSRGQWVTERFTESEINAAPGLTTRTVHN
ncbi:penicillin acylase family protein [Actinomadura barringtoniae]|uniref:Penicillin acylase family protein n=1 Tax=Actinomadura barringtoniae TaxID=1427535 RepID=A0A939PL56_9ACTN|nr:penicillin acylase family protein [Actinomadura barringtoniae]MBO2454635.1 penicillin acylase family protein [Actinomadura barringtoniae]